ncbi:MAG: HPF/RaiA family ribosome-associated protein [Candidatus Peribacteraceae bacterium]|nr:HPF/RaiA family ribosome-associated protein [Candidatus Peribacteraceae bacterium]
MLFSYRVDGYEVLPRDKELIETKLEKLEKFDNRLSRTDDDAVKVHVNLFRGTRHNSPNFGLKIQLTGPGVSFRGEASGKTVADAADEVERKLRAQIERIRG